MKRINLKLSIIVFSILIFLPGCSSNSPNTTSDKVSTNLSNDKVSTNSSNDKASTNLVSTNSSNSSNDKVSANSSTDKVSTNSSNDKAHSEQNISEKVTDYIINAQGNIPDADKMKWSKTFLKQVDLESLSKQYIANGGNANDLNQFAIYITQNAPIPSNWEALFKNDLYDTYGEKVARLEPLQGDLYQAYVIKDGSEVPYVVVSSRTGYFHG